VSGITRHYHLHVTIQSFRQHDMDATSVWGMRDDDGMLFVSAIEAVGISLDKPISFLVSFMFQIDSVVTHYNSH